MSPPVTATVLVDRATRAPLWAKATGTPPPEFDPVAVERLNDVPRPAGVASRYDDAARAYLPLPAVASAARQAGDLAGAWAAAEAAASAGDPAAELAHLRAVVGWLAADRLGGLAPASAAAAAYAPPPPPTA